MSAFLLILPLKVAEPILSQAAEPMLAKVAEPINEKI